MRHLVEYSNFDKQSPSYETPISQLLEFVINSDQSTPLKKLLTAKYSVDGKYILIENKTFRLSDGNEVDIPVNEEAWTLSDTLHTITDVASGVADFIVPGSGAIVDIANCLSYFIEGSFKTNETEKWSLWIMGLITGGMALMPGPMQALGVGIKNAIKTGAKITNKAMLKAIKFIYSNIGWLLKKIKELLPQWLKNKLVSTTVGKWGKRLETVVNEIVAKAEEKLAKIVGESVGEEGVELATTGVATRLLIPATSKLAKETTSQVSKLAVVTAKSTLDSKVGLMILNKMGINQSTKLSIGGASHNFKYIADDIIELGYANVVAGSTATRMTIMQWLNKFVFKSAQRKMMVDDKTIVVPIILKFLLNVFRPDGTVDVEKVKKQPPIPINQTEEDLAYLNKVIAKEQGPGQYTVNQDVAIIQRGLVKLGYDLGRFKSVLDSKVKDGSDGRYGPKTKASLVQFQNDINIDPKFKGTMNIATAKAISKALKEKGDADAKSISDKIDSILKRELPGQGISLQPKK